MDEHRNEHIHKHVLPDGTVIEHSHAGEGVHGAHGHQHSHTQTKAVLNRIARLNGHLTSIMHMIESGRDCSEVLVQLAAVRGAIDNVSKIILKDHMEHCIVDAVREGDKESIEMLSKAIDKFI